MRIIGGKIYDNPCNSSCFGFARKLREIQNIGVTVMPVGIGTLGAVPKSLKGYKK